MLASIKPSLKPFIASLNPAPPPHLGRRYDSTGKFQPEAGNTIVCHLVRGSSSEAAVLAVRERLLAMADADRLTFTPISSLHMTLFQGVIESRRHAPYWPPDIPTDADIDATTRIYGERLRAFEGKGTFKIKTIDVTPVGLTVAGATPADDRKLKEWRDALSIPFGYRHPDHDTYKFHITFAYMLRRLDAERAAEWQTMLSECLTLLEKAAPVIELRAPAFCSFADMNHFEELLVLGEETAPS